MKKDGFTLVELLIAFIILGIATAIAIPGFARWLPNYRLKSATRGLYANMQLAKMGAIRDRGEWAVFFNAGGGSYQVISGGADRDYETPGDNTTEKTITLSDYESGVSYGQGTVTIPIDASRPLGDSVTFDDSDDGDDVIVFNSRGMINEQEKSGGEAYISNINNSTYAVVCLATGVILMRKWTGTAWE
jgi:prepilin-type N-terminal cleavage/methylation domain-containing protein